MSWRRRLMMLAGAVGALLFALPPIAGASGGVLENTFGIRGTRGESIWTYQLSLDRGGATDAGKMIWSWIVDLCWAMYQVVMAAGIWLIDWALSYSWVGVVAAPFIEIGDAMQDVVDSLGLVPTMLTITALIGGVAMARGRWAKGGWDIALSLIIASLAAGIFAQPVRYIAGEDGVLYGARDTGLELAAAVMAKSTGATGANRPAPKTPGDARNELVGGMVDTFVRMPHQAVNFGTFIDGKKCGEAYQQGLTNAAGDTEKSTLRDKVKACDKNLGEYAEKPNVGMWITEVFIAPAALLFCVLAIVLAGAVISSGIAAMFQGLKAVVTLITGLLPGNNKRSALMTFAEALMYLVVLVFTTVFLSLFLGIIQTLFRKSSNPGLTFIIVDVLIVVAIHQYLVNRKRIKAAASGLASALAGPIGGGGGPASVPSGPSALSTVGSLAQLRAAGRQPEMSQFQSQSMNLFLGGADEGASAPVVVSGSAGPAGGGGPRAVGGGGGPRAVGGGGGPRPVDGGGGGPEALPSGDGDDGPPALPAGKGERAKKVLGAAGEVGLHALGALASGGTSTLASAAAVALKANRARQMLAAANQGRKALSAPEGQRREALLGTLRALPHGPSAANGTAAAVAQNSATKALPAGGPSRPLALPAGTGTAPTADAPRVAPPARPTLEQPAGPAPKTPKTTEPPEPARPAMTTPQPVPERPVRPRPDRPRAAGASETPVLRQRPRRTIEDGVVVLTIEE